MRSVAGRFVVAILLFAAGAVFLAEAREVQRLARFHERLVTLQYDRGNGDVQEDTGNGRWWPPRVLNRRDNTYQATLQYWRHRYDALSDATTLTGSANVESGASSDLLLLAANAAFRAAQERPSTDRALAVERLDRVVEAYANVLRAHPGHGDAAYNFEYVARTRDTLARGQKGRRPTKAPAPLEAIPSPDLPVGPTLHGHPGGPPPDIPGSDFRMIAPMPFEEREEAEPGQGPAPRRRG
jgi:hypothetical protein